MPGGESFQETAALETHRPSTVACLCLIFGPICCHPPVEALHLAFRAVNSAHALVSLK